MFGKRNLLLCAVLLLFNYGRSAPAADVDWTRVEKDATALLSEYIRIDTTNPPGNEQKAADFLAARFRANGIDAKVFPSGDKRAAVLARLRGTGGPRPLVLLAHLDVVPANAAEWEQPPFGGVVRDGYVYGRGALDMKGPAVVEFMTMVALKRAGVTLGRDVFFLGTPDEETGGQRGAGWFAEEHLAELSDVEFVLNEGGQIGEAEDGRRVVEVAVAEKTPFWVRLTATGEAGHGSTPRGDTSVTRLIRALERIRQIETPIEVVPEVEAYYRARAPYEAARRAQYEDIRAALADASFRTEFLGRPHDAALVRNTIAPTVLTGSNKTNVIPRTASAEIDCRLLPGQDPDAFLRQLKDAVGDDQIEFTVLLNFPPSSSGSDTALYRAIAKVAAAEGLPVVPSVLTGFTDSHYFRERGITSYGFIPVAVPEAEDRTVHGVNERIATENLREGTRRLAAILQALDQ